MRRMGLEYLSTWILKCMVNMYAWICHTANALDVWNIHLCTIPENFTQMQEQIPYMGILNYFLFFKSFGTLNEPQNFVSIESIHWMAVSIILTKPPNLFGCQKSVGSAPKSWCLEYPSSNFGSFEYPKHFFGANLLGAFWISIIQKGSFREKSCITGATSATAAFEWLKVRGKSSRHKPESKSPDFPLVFINLLPLWNHWYNIHIYIYRIYHIYIYYTQLLYIYILDNEHIPLEKKQLAV